MWWSRAIDLIAGWNLMKRNFTLSFGSIELTDDSEALKIQRPKNTFHWAFLFQRLLMSKGLPGLIGALRESIKLWKLTRLLNEFHRKLQCNCSIWSNLLEALYNFGFHSLSFRGLPNRKFRLSHFRAWKRSSWMRVHDGRTILRLQRSCSYKSS